jgi:hypothetical protein
MDKEAQLRALRELTGANTAGKSSNGANSPDDIAVMKYLDALRRKATSIEEVDVIDVIVKGLFYEGKNRITGRNHGEKSITEPVTNVTDVTENVTAVTQDSVTVTAPVTKAMSAKERMRRMRERNKGG